MTSAVKGISREQKGEEIKGVDPKQKRELSNGAWKTCSASRGKRNSKRNVALWHRRRFLGGKTRGVRNWGAVWATKRKKVCTSSKMWNQKGGGVDIGKVATGGRGRKSKIGKAKGSVCTLVQRWKGGFLGKTRWVGGEEGFMSDLRTGWGLSY